MNKKDKKIIFFGTPNVTIQILEDLKASGFLPMTIVTGPDVPIGRKQTITPPPTKVWALENNIPVLQPTNIDTAFVEQIKNLAPDLSIVVAYGKILPQTLIDIPAFGTINIHYSLLPKYRGATPVESAILHGDTETGVCIQKMVYELDAGDIIAEEKVAIDPNEKTHELRARLNIVAGEMLTKILPDIFENKITPIPQQGDISKCGKIKKEDGLITEEELKNAETDTNTARNLWNKFRAYTPWPSLFFFARRDSDLGSSLIRIKITDAIFENNQFIIKKVIPEGKKEMDYKNFLENFE
ncbi:MAG: methionyl-tRNA formyltransferase [bacterium]